MTLQSVSSESSCSHWESRLLALTQETRTRDLRLHLGKNVSWKQQIQPPSAVELNEIKKICGTKGISGRTFFQAVDHFLRIKVEPFQAMLTTWMQGAKAQVKGTDVPFTKVILWCQDTQDNEARRILVDELRRLCRFLAPFSHATWKVLITTLEEDLGYPDYISFCEQRRDTSLLYWGQEARRFLQETEDTYYSMIPPLLKEVTGLELGNASRFDAIYLLGLRYLDYMFPQEVDLERILDFFKTWEMDLSSARGLQIHTVGKSGRQSYCIPEQIPFKIHVVLGPIKGWLDLESLFHELGHALSFLYTDSSLSPCEKDFFPSGALSEAFAFLFQKMCVSRQFLSHVLGLSEHRASEMAMIHSAKWLALARRYAAKLVIEVENFKRGWLSRGQDFYAEMMHKATGFHYFPETYLFDLMPDFYSLDYFQAYMGSAVLWEYLEESVGPNWPLEKKTGEQLRKWWSEGNKLDLPSFVRMHLKKVLEPRAFLRKL